MNNRNYLSDVTYFFDLEKNGHLLVPDFLEKINAFDIAKYFSDNFKNLKIKDKELSPYSFFFLNRKIHVLQKEGKEIPNISLSSFILPVYDELNNLKGLVIDNAPFQLVINNPIIDMINNFEKTFKLLKVYSPVYPHSGWIVKEKDELKLVDYDTLKFPFYDWAKKKNLPSWDQVFFKEYLDLPKNKDSIFISVPDNVTSLFFFAELLKDPEAMSDEKLQTLCQPKTVFGFIDDIKNYKEKGFDDLNF